MSGHAAAMREAVEAINKIAEVRVKKEETPAMETAKRPKKVEVSISRKGDGAEMRILRVLAARHPARFTKAQWATLAWMKRTGGTWANYVSMLRKAGYLDENGDTVGLTSAGLTAAGDVERPAPGSVIRQWKEALGSGPSKMIDVLMEVHPRAVDRANLADRVNMTATGGTFANYISLLKTNGIAEIAGRKVKASSTLFTDEEQAA